MKPQLWRCAPIKKTVLMDEVAPAEPEDVAEDVLDYTNLHSTRINGWRCAYLQHGAKKAGGREVLKTA